MRATPARPSGTNFAFRQFILKIHGRCDLACDYCYVYTMADQRWRDRPRMMSRDTMWDTAIRISEHARAHRLDTVEVVLHGGEPLLAGPDAIGYCVRALRAAAPPGVRVDVSVQTNGVRLDPVFLALFGEHGVRVGVSLDGDAAAHDRHRRRANGTGSHARVAAALRLLGRPEHRRLFAGLLATIDLRNDPVRTYSALLEFQPPVLDFLLPHGNWATPPPGTVAGSAATPYADWLIAVFDRWYGAPRRETRIRLFEEIIALLLGGRSRTEGIGGAPTPFVVVETDGSVEGSDILASAYSGASATGLSVLDNSFDDAVNHTGITGTTLPCETCASCRVHRVCGGGLRAHRYRRENGIGDFDHPSVYCRDLYRLIDHIRGRLAADVAALRPAAS